MHTIEPKISKPSKMPCSSFSLPAVRCITGSKLASVQGTVCSTCYANKGRYKFSNVQAPREHNYQQLTEAMKTPEGREAWVSAMCKAIAECTTFAVPYFRWHDSGDLQSVEHLRMLCEVARRLPFITFWLPTRELAMCSELLFDSDAIPSNLTIRISAHKLGQTITPPNGVVSSSVGANHGYLCPATYTKDKKCGECRACWNSQDNIDYKAH